MPFGLKNAGETYQWAMTRIFDDLIHNQVECYIDDLVVKSKVTEAHMYDLRVVFEWLRRYDLKMNPLKSQKLRHYMLSHPISLISRVNPLQYLMTRPMLSGRLARWSMILLQFEITFIPLGAVKGQAVADFLAAHPLPADSPLNDNLPNEQIMSLRESGEAIWELYFDGAASSRRNTTQQSIVPGKARVGLIFITLEKGMMHFSYHLSEPCINNKDEYEALITGLELAILMEIKMIEIFWRFPIGDQPSHKNL
ncbi:hypothetical protein MA16_Dca026414 [Dendrobium catenatum]|uniref:Reverse transcriptase domain-containing protein n=1 Tax=Dendrobium catenatum TaxID=906689 RepID=A0A2I0VDA4_9ASPA|nr:hypothetical protein MA16_Dca026414 [Dendrobium catenatum]